uniref:Uncharacterized protein n=1 Tax=Cannabis sativa TaxID=3483 RepID=A0A803Q7I4_CANSA
MLLCVFFLVIGASSHIINFDACRRFARELCLLTEHGVVSLASSGSFKRECAVRPPGRMEAVTPDEAVASATRFLDLTVANRALYKNVFPVPPGPSTKNAYALFDEICSITTIYTCRCSAFREWEAVISSSGISTPNSSLISLD